MDQPSCAVLNIKQAELGDDLIIRLIETEGQAVSAKLSLPHLTIDEAWYNNLVEENLGPLRHTKKEVTVPMRAFGISTVRIKAAPTP